MDKSNPLSRLVAISTEGAYNFQLATEAANNGDKARALIYIDKVIATDPKHALAWHVKGNCLDEIGRCEDALTCYNTAIALDPFSSESWFNKGLTLKKMGREEEANTCMSRAVEIALGE